MSHFTIYKLIGYLSIVIGIFASLCMYRLENIYTGVGLSILGFIVSGVNIFMNNKYYSDEETYPKGLMGMVFSSLPVLFLLFVIFKHRHP